jgi:hypothetical protein
MSSVGPLHKTHRGWQAVSPPERASFGMLSAFGTTIAISRGINYARERRRSAPRLRSWARRVHHSPGKEQLRVHHFLPGMGLAFATGGAAIMARSDGREFWLSLPFGTGVALTMDEIALLVQRDNPYWDSETLALVQAGAAALAAATLAARFHRQGSARPRAPSTSTASRVATIAARGGVGLARGAKQILSLLVAHA